MAAALGLFMRDECASYLRHCDHRFGRRWPAVRYGRVLSPWPIYAGGRTDGRLKARARAGVTKFVIRPMRLPWIMSSWME